MADTEQELIAKYQKQATTDLDAGFDQRDACNEDIRFTRIAKSQWEGVFRDSSYDSARFVYDQTERSVNSFLGEYSNNPVDVKFSSDDDATDDTDANVLTGLYRADNRRSNGKAALRTAIREASTGGYGALRLVTSEVDEDDDEDDRQQIDFEPIWEAYATVIWEANAKKDDKSDANRCTVLHQYTQEAFEDKWPEAEKNSFITMSDRRYLNFSTSDDFVVVAERYEVKKVKLSVMLYQNPLTGKTVEYAEDDILDVMDELEEFGFVFVKRKKIRRTEVIKTILSGAEFLEKPERVAGTNIPVIPFYGSRDYIDGEEIYSGLVRKMKDAQRSLNMAVSQVTEIAATSTRETPIFNPEQVEGHENNWAQAHLGNKPYQLLNPLTDAQGNVLSAGAVGFVKPPMVAPATSAVIEIANSQLQMSQAQNPGEMTDLRASGAAIAAVRRVVDLDTAPMVEMFASGAKRVGVVWKGMAKEIYADSRPVKIINEDGTERRVVINQSIIDRQTGESVKLHDLAQSKFDVVAEAGASFNTRREQTAKGLSELMPLLPEGSPLQAAAIGGLIQNIDGTGLDDLKRIARRTMLLEGLAEPQSDEEIMWMQQMQQQAQMQSQNQQPDPNMLIGMAEAKKAEAQGIRAVAGAQKDIAQARKYEAETVETLSQIPLNQAKTLETQKNANSKTLDNLSKILTARQGQLV